MADEGKENNYTILKWNKKYSNGCKFVVRDNSSGRQSIFTPGRCQDLVWARTNLAEQDGMDKWSDFGEETVDNLQDVAF